jgi:hypothetical protein
VNTYLRILAVFYLYGALVHLADLLSLGHHLGQTHGLAFPEMSLPWQIGTVGFAAVDLVAAAGLWLRASWGVMAFLAAAVAQIVMYTFYSATFGNHRGLVGFHLATHRDLWRPADSCSAPFAGFLTADGGLVVTALPGHPEVLSGHHSSLD